MVPSNDLFILIKHLSSSEKRYFSIWSSKHTVGKKNIYLKLFEDLEYFSSLEDDYNEKMFLKKFKNKPYCKNFAYNKNYLFEQLMEAMRSFSKQEVDVSDKIFDLLKDIGFYREKRLLTLWKKAIERAQELAIIHEKHHLRLLIETESYNYEIENNQQNLPTLLKTIANSRNDILSLLILGENLKALQAWLFLIVRIYGQSTLPKELKKEVDDKINSPLIKSFVLGVSKKNDLSLHYILYYYHFINKNDFDSTICQEKIYELTLKNNEFVSTSEKIKASANFLTALLLSKNWSKFSEVLREMKSIPTWSENEKGELFQNHIFYELLYFLNMGDLPAACELEAPIMRGFKKYETKINTARKISILVNLSLAFFVFGNFEKSRFYFLSICDENSPARTDIKTIARFHYLISLFEIKDFEMLENSIRNLKRSKEYVFIENSSLFFLISLLEDLTKCFKKNKNYVSVLKNISPDDIKSVEVRCWILSLIENKKISRIYKSII